MVSSDHLFQERLCSHRYLVVCLGCYWFRHASKLPASIINSGTQLDIPNHLFNHHHCIGTIFRAVSMAGYPAIFILATELVFPC